MSPKSFKISSTAASSPEAWITTEVTLRVAKGSTNARLDDPYTELIAARRSINDQGNPEIILSIEPATVSKKLAIRKLNEELEGRFSATETFASKTAG